MFYHKQEKILITGTGRCGTTFLILIFSLLGLDTGYNIQNFKNDISEKCNSGMERLIDSPHKILKNPRFIDEIESIVQKNNIVIKNVIIPIRDYSKCATSRVNLGEDNGGLWNASDYESQITFFHKIMATYNYFMVKYNIPTTFIDFDKMTNDSNYLYNKLAPLLEGRTYQQFLQAFQIATIHQNKSLKEKYMKK